MIKAQVKALIELSFRLISLLLLPAKALHHQTPPLPSTLRGGVSLPKQRVFHSGRQNNTALMSPHIDMKYVVFNKRCIENERVPKLNLCLAVYSGHSCESIKYLNINFQAFPYIQEALICFGHIIVQSQDFPC